MYYLCSTIIKTKDMTKRESIIDQIDVYLNMNSVNGCLSKAQQQHLYELTYNYINVGSLWEEEVKKVLKQNGYMK